MQKQYFNVMENLVETEFELRKDTLDCCICDQCANDIMALTLNQLPPKYVVTSKGALFTKLQNAGTQCRSDILAAMLKSVEIVKKAPRH